MKGEIAAYITALINNHQRFLDLLGEIPSIDNIASRSNQENFINELNDLLDFVEDIPEVKKEKNNLRTIIMKIFRR